jgi:2-dehydro-3-deoxygluconokinase
LIEIATSANISGFDFNYRPQLHSNKLENQELLKEIDKNINIHFISFDDAKYLFGIRNPLEIFNILENKNLLLIRYKSSVFFKNGSNEVKVINVPHGKVVDMTAAGDSFNGSFLALLNNKNISIEENILISHSVTREVIKHRGAIISKNKMPKIKT